ncbi:DUF1801 domain-containing protein [Pedobacter lithocola]|uniref:DUF1801 domain-containing protein n=1 Tax=Pedobacter lithocola TaxID=1908239 RepID=A0ABV8P5P9_9SPHI
MAKTKTIETALSVRDFIESYADSEEKKTDSYRLIELMTGWSGFDARLWGTSIIGFGSYHYKYESGHEGDAPLMGFSPRKSAFSLYVFSPIPEQEKMLGLLGKFKIGKACIYVKKLSDINTDVLEKMARTTIAYIEEHHECACREH